MFTISHEDRIADMRLERERAMRAARLARALECDELKREMVAEACELHRHILKARRQSRRQAA